MASNRRRTIAGLFAEVSFAALPLLIVLMVLLNYRHGDHIVWSPEWSFGAAILFGQALVKFMTGMAHGGHAAHGPVALAITLIIVLGLAPSLLVLTLILMDLEADPRRQPADWLSVLQVVLFLCAAATYLVFGAIGELWRHEEKIAVVERRPSRV
jgi:hypothetical protein